MPPPSAAFPALTAAALTSSATPSISAALERNLSISTRMSVMSLSQSTSIRRFELLHQRLYLLGHQLQVHAQPRHLRPQALELAVEGFLSRSTPLLLQRRQAPFQAGQRFVAHLTGPAELSCQLAQIVRGQVAHPHRLTRPTPAVLRFPRRSLLSLPGRLPPLPAIPQWPPAALVGAQTPA